ncbi:MAG: hypothetical protein GVY35_09230 [Bacteroidetes bacterium]|nr:hypothetical protein [Bacteroidota bacterium]
MMSTDYALFDASHIQRSIRHRMFRLDVLLCGIGFLTLAALFVGRAGALSPPGVAGFLTGSLLLIGALIWRRRHLARTIWCVKVSPEGVVGYDCARRKMRIRWTDVEQIDVTDEALLVIESPYRFVTISVSFFDYPTLSHCVLAYAEPHDIPLALEGHLVNDLNVYALYPFLTDEPPADASGSAA